MCYAFPRVEDAGAGEDAAAAAAALAQAKADLQTVRRVTKNPNRCTMEFLIVWRQGGDARKKPVKDYIANPDVTKLAVDIIMSDVLSQHPD